MTILQRGKRQRTSRKACAEDGNYWAGLRELEQLPPDTWDFQYVKNLPKHLQRMAAFWEFAIESKPLRNAFETGPKVKEKELNLIR